MSHAFVRLSGSPALSCLRNPGVAKPRFETMKNRFPTLNRATWRSRFVAIARQADDARRATVAGEAAPRRVANASERAAIRVRFAAITSA